MYRQLVKGTAEVFGTELALGVEYTFSGRKAAVYTWHGCTLEISFFCSFFSCALRDCDHLQSLTPQYVKGQFSVEYTANETPMTSYLNTHLALQQMRESAKQKGDVGPRVSLVFSQCRDVFSLL